jgi:hypothetical protein
MDKRLTFNEDPANYERYRPRYCKELFDSIIEYSRINQTKKALEIGIGTGQATLPAFYLTHILTIYHWKAI